MRRRKVAKKHLPAKVRDWVANFQGKDLVRGYRKQYNASWSCAIIELGMLGVSFPPEDVAEAKRRQVASIQSEISRKTKRREAKRLEEYIESIEAVQTKRELEFSEHFMGGPISTEHRLESDFDNDLGATLDTLLDEYEPFAD